ncbi:hypothetical protein DV454_001948 [Geotrichum candidum]|nr:hypothetical protein DV454_001948 [Geotrichum candidum]
MSLTENIPSRRQYSHATGNSESFELFEPTAPNNSNSYRNSPPPPPPARNNAAFSTNNPFRRAPPPPTNNNVSTSPASYHEHHHQKSDSSFLQVSQNIDPSYRSHSANHLESNHTGSSVQNSMPISIPPNNRVSIYNNSQYSNSDQSVFINNPQRGPSLPQQQQARRDVKSYLSHSSHDSTSSQSSANRTATGSAAAARRKSTNPFLDWDEPAPAPQSRSIPNERLIEEDFEEFPRPSRSKDTSDNYSRNNASNSYADDSYSSKPSPRHLLRRTNSNDSIFAAPEQQRAKPQRPPQASKPQYSNRQSLYVNKPKPEFAPPKTRHTRSNSDSSVMEPPVRQSSSQRQGERRGSDDRYKSSSSSRRNDDKYKESSSRRHHSSTKDKKSSSSSRRSKKGPPLDTIDRLDVTGFFGPGNFHHDGPFDACTPHRNKHTKKAPVAAFPIDGPNNTVTGVDPNRDRYTSENQIMGRSEGEAFQDFSMPLRGGAGGSLGRSHDGASMFDSTLKEKPVHGDTSLGLGSSTFLNGAPASKIATDKFNQEQQQGLSRKKSLAQRFRGGNGQGPSVSRDTKIGTAVSTPGGGMGRTESPTSPTGDYLSGETSSPEQPQPKSNGLLRRVKSLKVGSSRR